MAHETFLNGKVQLCCGDSLHFLRDQLDNRYDSIVTDPPYALVSITKRFGANGAAPVKVPAGGSGVYARASAGFMGQKWDTGETAFAVEFWEQCLRVLKPGGHVVAFGGTRTYHRLACAIEDAGFEVRDMLQYLYGSGFPKSHDVSKGIDRNHHSHKIGWFGKWLREERATRKISQKELAERGGFFSNVNHGGLVANWELGYSIPSAEDFNKVCELLNVDFPPIEEFEREVIGRRKVNAGVAFTSSGPTEIDVTLPSSAAACEWQGWGTALKPACEPIFFGRKPLGEKTVAGNVLQYGTGAINIDGCRVASGDLAIARASEQSQDRRYTENGRTNFAEKPGARRITQRVNRAEMGYHGGLAPEYSTGSDKGRWPANICHDGSDEVLAAFPDVHCAGSARDEPLGGDDGGNASRFFYTAKADSDDRLGSKHPTVKPVDLMQWLVRLVTPKGGLVLDPFAGTGTTAEACYREGMRCMLIERETEYQADIRRRMALVKAGPDERSRESIKAKNLPVDHGPLFGGSPSLEGGAG